MASTTITVSSSISVTPDCRLRIVVIPWPKGLLRIGAVPERADRSADIDALLEDLPGHESDRRRRVLVPVANHGDIDFTDDALLVEQRRDVLVVELVRIPSTRRRVVEVECRFAGEGGQRIRAVLILRIAGAADF